MPTPFPGMDPYLEGPLWSSFHALFAPEIIRLLNPQLRPRYIALAQQYQQISSGEEIGIAQGRMYPDLGVVRTSAAPLEKSSAGVATQPLEMTLLMPFPVPHQYIEIRDQAQRALVTVIEFLSPANKKAPGRKKYQRKRQRILRSSAHLLEIDLLHLGRRIPVDGPLPATPYFVFLSRLQRRPTVQIWPIRLDEPLPRVPVPLAGADPDVTLDLQAAFTATFDLGGFEDLIDYRTPPPSALGTEEAAWLDRHLRNLKRR